MNFPTLMGRNRSISPPRRSLRKNPSMSRSVSGSPPCFIRGSRVLAKVLLEVEVVLLEVLPEALQVLSHVVITSSFCLLCK